jgi:23S rRNA (uracil1939-C5)-methyltransferase
MDLIHRPSNRERPLYNGWLEVWQEFSRDQMIIVTIEKLAYGGYGVGRHQGKVVFVPFGLPGDEVEVDIYWDKERYAYGSITQILKPAKNRIAPQCPHFLKCGGCHWQHLPYEDQLQWKETLLKETLDHVGQIKTMTLNPIIPAPDPWHYRHRIQLHVGKHKEIGFYSAPGEPDGIVPIETCPIADDTINAALQTMDRDKAMALGSRIELVSDPKTQSFTQVNLAQNQNLIQTVLKFAQPFQTDPFNVLEFFAGNGNLSYPLANHGAHVTAVEQNKYEHEEHPNIDFIFKKAHRALNDILASPRLFDLVLLDPPRQGIKQLLPNLIKLNVPQIIYVSCYPPTLARDLKAFIAAGYQIDVIQPLDMFPQTYHIEAVVKLSHRGNS